MIPKFRAWDKDAECMIYQKDNGDEYVWQIGTEDIWIEPIHGMTIPKQVLMQSAGLKDKNGVEIFDGDIVAVENHPFQRKEDRGVGIEIEGNYVVGWDQHDLTWCAGDLLLARLKPYVKVIGNVYENSNILEDGI